MNLNDLVKKYGLLLDEEGRYYLINDQGIREEPYCSIRLLTTILELSIQAIEKRIQNLAPLNGKNYKGRKTLFFNLNDVLDRCSDLIDKNLTIVNENGWAFINNKKYTSVPILAEKFGISQNTIKSRIKNLISIKGKKHGKVCMLYSFKEAAKACSDLLSPLPKSNRRGMAVINGQLFASILPMAKYLHLADCTISDRIKKHNLTFQNIIAANHRIVKAYSVKEVRTACRDLLKPYPTANKSGFCIYKSKKYATINALSKKISIENHAIKERIKENKIKPIRIFVKNRLSNAYYLNEVRKICTDLIYNLNLPKSNASGITIIAGQKYVTIYRLAEICKTARATALKRIIDKNVKSLKIKGLRHRFICVYNLEQSKKACSDLLRDIPIANKNGTAIISGRKYATINYIAKRLSLSPTGVIKRIKKLHPIKIKSHKGPIANAYSYKDVKVCCSDLIQKRPLLRKNSFIINRGRKFATITFIACKLGIASASVKSRIKHLRPINVKSRVGRIVKVFNYKRVKKACADILNKKTKPVSK